MRSFPHFARFLARSLILPSVVQTLLILIQFSIAIFPGVLPSRRRVFLLTCPKPFPSCGKYVLADRQKAKMANKDM